MLYIHAVHVHCIDGVQERNIQTSADWRQQMGHVDVSILQHMRDNIKGGFDEERHGPRIGFGNLKRWAAVCVAVTMAHACLDSCDVGPSSQCCWFLLVVETLLRSVQHIPACCLSAMCAGSWRTNWPGGTVMRPQPPWHCCR
jgi:hypothetical protein